MQRLFELGLKPSELEKMLIDNPFLNKLSDEDIKVKIDALLDIGCNHHHIINIIMTNPFYLTNVISSVTNLINKLKSLNINNLNILFDSNPYLLNAETFEIDEFIEKKEKLGLSLIDIVDIIESNPYFLEDDI